MLPHLGHEREMIGSPAFIVISKLLLHLPQVYGTWMVVM